MEINIQFQITPALHEFEFELALEFEFEFEPALALQYSLIANWLTLVKGYFF